MSAFFTQVITPIVTNVTKQGGPVIHIFSVLDIISLKKIFFQSSVMKRNNQDSSKRNSESLVVVKKPIL